MVTRTLRDLADRLAAITRGFGDALDEAGRLALRALAGAPRYVLPSGRYIRFETTRQIYFTAVQGLPVILRAAVSLGFLIAFALLSLGVERIAVLIRALEVSIYANLIPILVAFIVIGRSGAALTSDVASFRIGQTVDAFAAMNLEPVHFMVLPRIVGMTISLLLLTFWMAFAAYATSVLIHLVIHPTQLARALSESARLFAAGPVLLTILKVALFGLSIAAVHCMFGLRCRTVIDIARNIPSAFVASSSWCMACNEPRPICLSESDSK